MTPEAWAASNDPGWMLSSCKVWGWVAPTYKPSDRKLRLWIAAMCDASGANYFTMGDRLDCWRKGEKWVGGNSAEFLDFEAQKWCDTELDLPGDPTMSQRADLLRELLGDPWRAPISHEESWITPQVLALAGDAYEQRQVSPCKRCKGKGFILRRISDDGVGRSTASENCPACYGRGHSGCLVLEELTVLALADALEEAGCTAQEIMVHLRSGGPHVRGCWVIDQFLGLS